MINLIFLLFIIFIVIWTAKKFYFPTKIAEHPELYPIQQETKISKKEMATILAHLQRWRQEGKISREEYDHLTDICLAETQPPKDDPK